MIPITSLSDQIHQRVIEISTQYKHSEAELIDVLQEVETHLVYLKRGHASLYAYATHDLGLSENIAYSLITVARKAREIPELKTKLHSGSMTLSNARRITSVITPENKSEWIHKATELTSRQLEKEIVKFRPAEATKERVSYVTPERMKLELGLSEDEMNKLRRVQDLLSQSQKRAVSLEETLTALTSEFLDRHDPVEKAKRHALKIERHTDKVKENDTKSPQLVTQRVPIPAFILHQVNLRDQRRCAYQLSNGSKCDQSRWTEIHHIRPVSKGGLNTPENLITLCSAHHKLQHL